MLSELSPTELAIYEARVFFNPKPTLEQVGQSLGLTSERVRQIQVKAENKIGSSARSRRFLPLLWRASDLSSVLALAAPADSEVTSAAFNSALRDCKNEADRVTNLLLRLAGPYRRQNGWYLKVGESVPSPKDLQMLADENGILQLEQAHAWLRQHGINPAFLTTG